MLEFISAGEFGRENLLSEAVPRKAQIYCLQNLHEFQTTTIKEYKGPIWIDLVFEFDPEQLKEYLNPDDDPNFQDILSTCEVWISRFKRSTKDYRFITKEYGFAFVPMKDSIRASIRRQVKINTMFCSVSDVYRIRLLGDYSITVFDNTLEEP